MRIGIVEGSIVQSYIRFLHRSGVQLCDLCQKSHFQLPECCWNVAQVSLRYAYVELYALPIRAAQLLGLSKVWGLDSGG